MQYADRENNMTLAKVAKVKRSVINWAMKFLEIAKTLINYLYLPKSIKKVNRGVLFLYKGFVLFGRAY